ncbi:MAG: DJ-1/PfpI family protein [Acidobacteriota bacterium]
MAQRNVAILLFEDVEVLDFAGPFEVFSVTSEVVEDSPFQVYTTAKESGPIRARNGLWVLADHPLGSGPRADVVVIPGGRGSRAALRCGATMGWLQESFRSAEVVLSVCTGALLLGTLGLLDGLEVTTHHENLEELAQRAPKAILNGDHRFIDHGKIVTSGGISAGIDASLHLVDRLVGPSARKLAETYMEYGDSWRS